MTKLAIIPARAGSKRLKNKNVLPIAGKPLISWTIEAALTSHLFDEVLVSTDSQEIADLVSTQYGINACNIEMRPLKLSNDTAAAKDVIRYHLLTRNHSEICYLQPTSPLRQDTDILEAHALMTHKNADCVIGVAELMHPVEWSFEEKGEFRHFLKSLSVKRSQDYPRRYAINGAIYWFKRESFFELGTHLFGNNPQYFVMPSARSVDIDDELDFQFAGLLLERSLAEKLSI